MIDKDKLLNYMDRLSSLSQDDEYDAGFESALDIIREKLESGELDGYSNN